MASTSELEVLAKRPLQASARPAARSAPPPELLPWLPLGPPQGPSRWQWQAPKASLRLQRPRQAALAQQAKPGLLVLPALLPRELAKLPAPLALLPLQEVLQLAPWPAQYLALPQPTHLWAGPLRGWQLACWARGQRTQAPGALDSLAPSPLGEQRTLAPGALASSAPRDRKSVV